jgi:hypothetical protein
MATHGLACSSSLWKLIVVRMRSGEPGMGKLLGVAETHGLDEEDLFTAQPITWAAANDHDLSLVVDALASLLALRDRQRAMHVLLALVNIGWRAIPRLFRSLHAANNHHVRTGALTALTVIALRSDPETRSIVKTSLRRLALEDGPSLLGPACTAALLKLEEADCIQATTSASPFVWAPLWRAIREAHIRLVTLD